MGLGIISRTEQGAWVLTSPGEFVFRFPDNWPFIDGLGLRWYGLLMAVAVLVGLFLAKYLAERQHLEREPGQASERIENLALWLVLGGFIGARIYYVVSHWSEFQANPLASVAIWQGGIIIHGGILGAALVLYLYSRFTSIAVWKYADVLTPSLILGQAIGRWGNFFNAEAYGAPIPPDSNWPIRQFIPPLARVVDPLRQVDLSQFEHFHPIFLYESLLNILLFALLMTMFWKAPKLKDGTWVWTYLVGYSLIRIPYEILRVSAVAYVGNTSIKVAYLASGIGIVLGIGMLIYLYIFRWDPDLDQVSAWLSESVMLDPGMAKEITHRLWQIERKYKHKPLTEKLDLALPYFPGTLVPHLSTGERETLVKTLLSQLSRPA
jgi:phosphatidylglycerol:prolipoprotein diacylglycerol transferase